MESAKQCVKTHLPKQLALKMDGTQALHLYLAVGVGVRPRRARGRSGLDAGFGASLGETASGADLGGSSKYSN